MKAVGKFFGLERTNEFYEEVVEKTSFDYVKAKRDAQSKSVRILKLAVDFYINDSVSRTQLVPKT